jgi:hypothetical protein
MHTLGLQLGSNFKLIIAVLVALQNLYENALLT